MALLQLLKVLILSKAHRYHDNDKVDDVLGGKPELETFKRGSDKVMMR